MKKALAWGVVGAGALGYIGLIGFMLIDMLINDWRFGVATIGACVIVVFLPWSIRTLSK